MILGNARGMIPTPKEDMSALVIDNSYLINKDFSFTLLGCVKEFRCLKKLHVICNNEGFHDVVFSISWWFMGFI